MNKPTHTRNTDESDLHLDYFDEPTRELYLPFLFPNQNGPAPMEGTQSKYHKHTNGVSKKNTTPLPILPMPAVVGASSSSGSGAQGSRSGSGSTFVSGAHSQADTLVNPIEAAHPTAAPAVPNVADAFLTDEDGTRLLPTIASLPGVITGSPSALLFGSSSSASSSSSKPPTSGGTRSSLRRRLSFGSRSRSRSRSPSPTRGGPSTFPSGANGAPPPTTVTSIPFPLFSSVVSQSPALERTRIVGIECYKESSSKYSSSSSSSGHRFLVFHLRKKEEDVHDPVIVVSADGPPGTSAGMPVHFGPPSLEEAWMRLDRRPAAAGTGTGTGAGASSAPGSSGGASGGAGGESRGRSRSLSGSSGKGLGLVGFMRNRGKVEPSDIVTLAGSRADLVGTGSKKPVLESSVVFSNTTPEPDPSSSSPVPAHPFHQNPTLATFLSIGDIIAGETVEYRSWPENANLFYGLLQDYLTESATSAREDEGGPIWVEGGPDQLDASAGLGTKGKDAKEIKEIKERVYRRVWKIPYGAKIPELLKTLNITGYWKETYLPKSIVSAEQLEATYAAFLLSTTTASSPAFVSPSAHPNTPLPPAVTKSLVDLSDILNNLCARTTNPLAGCSLAARAVPPIRRLYASNPRKYADLLTTALTQHSDRLADALRTISSSGASIGSYQPVSPTVLARRASEVGWEILELQRERYEADPDSRSAINKLEEGFENYLKLLNRLWPGAAAGASSGGADLWNPLHDLVQTYIALYTLDPERWRYLHVPIDAFITVVYKGHGITGEASELCSEYACTATRDIVNSYAYVLDVTHDDGTQAYGELYKSWLTTLDVLVERCVRARRWAEGLGHAEELVETSRDRFRSALEGLFTVPPKQNQSGTTPDGDDPAAPVSNELLPSEAAAQDRKLRHFKKTLAALTRALDSLIKCHFKLNLPQIACRLLLELMRTHREVVQKSYEPEYEHTVMATVEQRDEWIEGLIQALESYEDGLNTATKAGVVGRDDDANKLREEVEKFDRGELVNFQFDFEWKDEEGGAPPPRPAHELEHGLGHGHGHMLGHGMQLPEADADEDMDYGIPLNEIGRYNPFARLPLEPIRESSVDDTGEFSPINQKFSFHDDVASNAGAEESQPISRPNSSRPASNVASLMIRKSASMASRPTSRAYSTLSSHSHSRSRSPSPTPSLGLSSRSSRSTPPKRQSDAPVAHESPSVNSAASLLSSAPADSEGEKTVSGRSASLTPPPPPPPRLASRTPSPVQQRRSNPRNSNHHVNFDVDSDADDSDSDALSFHSAVSNPLEMLDDLREAYLAGPSLARYEELVEGLRDLAERSLRSVSRTSRHEMGIPTPPVDAQSKEMLQNACDALHEVCDIDRAQYAAWPQWHFLHLAYSLDQYAGVLDQAGRIHEAVDAALAGVATDRAHRDVKDVTLLYPTALSDSSPSSAASMISAPDSPFLRIHYACTLLSHPLIRRGAQALELIVDAIESLHSPNYRASGLAAAWRPKLEALEDYILEGMGETGKHVPRWFEEGNVQWLDEYAPSLEGGSSGTPSPRGSGGAASSGAQVVRIGGEGDKGKGKERERPGRERLASYRSKERSKSRPNTMSGVSFSDHISMASPMHTPISTTPKIALVPPPAVDQPLRGDDDQSTWLTPRHTPTMGILNLPAAPSSPPHNQSQTFSRSLSPSLVANEFGQLPPHIKVIKLEQRTMPNPHTSSTSPTASRSNSRSRTPHNELDAVESSAASSAGPSRDHSPSAERELHARRSLKRMTNTSISGSRGRAGSSGSATKKIVWEIDKYRASKAAEGANGSGDGRGTPYY